MKEGERGETKELGHGLIGWWDQKHMHGSDERRLLKGSQFHPMQGLGASRRYMFTVPFYVGDSIGRELRGQEVA